MVEAQVKRSGGRGRIQNLRMPLVGRARVEALQMQLRALERAQTQILDELEEIEADENPLAPPTRLFRFTSGDFDSNVGGLTPLGHQKLSMLNTYAKHMTEPAHDPETLSHTYARALRWRLGARGLMSVRAIFDRDPPVPFVRYAPARVWRRWHRQRAKPSGPHSDATLGAD